MKKVIKKSLVLVALIASIATNASDGFTAEKDITKITFENVKKGSELLIKDNQGLVLYRESIKESGTYSKGFDLTALPNGDYYFEMDKEIIIEIVPFVVASKAVLFEKEKMQIINKPFMIKKGENLIISKLALGYQPLELAIYFENGDLAFSDKIEGLQVIEKIYDFSKSEHGNYMVVLKSEGRSFKNNFNF